MASTTSIPAETTRRCAYGKVSVGSVYSRHSFGKIIEKSHDQVTIENSNGDKWTIGAGIIELEFSFADQYDSEEQISRTALIELMTNRARTAMTIQFNKKPDPKVIAKELEAGKGSATAKAWNAKVKTLLEGEERVMVGYHVNSFDEHRRLRFQESDKGQRLVDPRTLTWMIVDRVKFTVSK